MSDDEAKKIDAITDELHETTVAFKSEGDELIRNLHADFAEVDALLSAMPDEVAKLNEEAETYLE